MKIILLRHGETIWNKERRLQGCQDIPLSDEGRELIRKAGQQLAQNFPHIDQILTSPLTRATESARIIARELHFSPEAILTEPLFTERNFGVGEGLTYEEALAKYPDSNYPGMETLDDLYRRAEAAIHQCVKEYSDRTVLVVAHGAIIKATLVALTNGRIAYFDENVWISNGSYCLLEYEQKEWKIFTNPHSRSPLASQSPP